MEDAITADVQSRIRAGLLLSCRWATASRAAQTWRRRSCSGARRTRRRCIPRRSWSRCRCRRGAAEEAARCREACAGAIHRERRAPQMRGADTACKNEVFRVGGSFCDSTAFTASSSEFGHRMGTRAGCPSTVMPSPEQAAGRVACYRNHAIAEAIALPARTPLRPLRARHRCGRGFPARAGEAGHPVCARRGKPRVAGTCSSPTTSVWRDSTPRLGASAGVGSTAR